VEGGTVAYTLACSRSSAISKVSYHGDTYEGTMVTAGTGQQTSTMEIQGKRLGPCP
jgi:hypothetical protein